jgi:hypothetical protein
MPILRVRLGNLVWGGYVTGAAPLTPEPLPAILREGSPSPALICPDDGTVVSHGELASAVRRLAGVLAGLGLHAAFRG